VPFDGDYRSGLRVAVASIVISSLLALTNIAVGLLAHSTSVLAAGVEFAGDVIASAIVLVGLQLASRPPDAEHPYGHGRIETLAGFLLGVLLAGAGLAICYHSLQAIGLKHAPPGSIAIAALAVAIVLRTIMSIVKFRVGRRINSSSLVADAWNDTVDILSAVAALTAVALATYNPDRFLAADHYGGFAVGLVVIITGIRVVRETSLELMDTMPSSDRTDRIQEVASQVPGVIRVEKSFARKTGLQYHVDLHIEVDPNMTVAGSHEIAARVRSTLRRELPWVADVLVHVEPARKAR
jgi:cation diffusion facilitator family transporter